MWKKLLPFSREDVREYKTVTTFGCREQEHTNTSRAQRMSPKKEVAIEVFCAYRRNIAHTRCITRITGPWFAAGMGHTCVPKYLQLGHGL